MPGRRRRRVVQIPNERRPMPNVDAHVINTHVIKFQCPHCGHDLERSIGLLKSNEPMKCPGCGIGINIDTDRLANAADEIHHAVGKMPPEITIKFFR